MIYWYWNILKYIVDRWIFSNSKNRRGHSYKGTMNRGNPLEVSPSISGSPWKIPWKNPTLGTLGFPVLGLKKTQLINIWRLENNPWIDQATRVFLNWVKTTCDAFAVNIYLLSRWHHGGLSAGVNCTFLWLIIMFPLNPAISWGLNRSKHTMFRLTQLGNCRYGYGSNPSTAIFSNGASNKTLSGGDSRGRGTGTSGDCKESHSCWWDDMGWPYIPHWSHVIWPWHPLGAKNKDPSHIPTFLWFCLSRLDWLKGKSAGSQMEKTTLGFLSLLQNCPEIIWFHLEVPPRRRPSCFLQRVAGKMLKSGRCARTDQSRANVHTQESPRRVVNLPVVGTSPFFLLEPQTRGPAHFFHFCWNHPIWSPNNSK